MKNSLLLLSPLFLLFACSDGATYEKAGVAGWHKINVGEFSLITPTDVKYVAQEGQDSFVGEFIGDSIQLSFDHGAYSNSLIPTPEEYLNSIRFLREVIDGLFITLYEKDSTATYPTENQVSILKVHQDSSAEWKYFAEVKYQDSIRLIAFEYPREYQKYEFDIDTIDQWYIKRVYPVVQEKGMMGVYIEHVKETKGWGHYPKLNVVFEGEQRSDEYKLTILRSVRMK